MILEDLSQHLRQSPMRSLEAMSAPRLGVRDPLWEKWIDYLVVQAAVLRELLPFKFSDSNVCELLLWSNKHGQNKKAIAGADW